MLQLIRNTFGVEDDVRTIHAEGSLASQRMMIYGESIKEIMSYSKQAKELAGIEKVDALHEELYRAIK
jgi:hypothetical protein